MESTFKSPFLTETSFNKVPKSRLLLMLSSHSWAHLPTSAQTVMGVNLKKKKRKWKQLVLGLSVTKPIEFVALVGPGYI